MGEELRDYEYKNFVSVYRGLAYVGQKLEHYTYHGLNKTHQEIYRKLAGNPVCEDKCSLTHKGQIGKWCTSCKDWKAHLLRFRRNPNVSWEGTKSWEWPNGCQNIAEVYLPASWRIDDLDLKDIGTTCFIWENCRKYFKIRLLAIKRLRECRNKYFAHNSTLKLTDIEKAHAFDVLKDIINDQDVHAHIDIQDCMKELQEIESGFQEDQWKDELDMLRQHQGEIRKSQNEMHMSQRNIENDQEIMKDEFCKFKKELVSLLNRKQNKGFLQSICSGKTPSLMMCLIVLVIILVVCFKQLYFHQETPNISKRKGCVSEDYRFPFPQDLPLIGYLHEEHRTIIGRHWLLEHIKQELVLPSNSSQSGLVLIADMGYGKSAIVTKLLCPESNEIAAAIQKHIVAFHVCKFDVRSTACTERFIRRLVGFLSMKSPEYGNIISMLPEKSILFSRDDCEKEPDACFDQGIILPLKQLKEKLDTPWIVVIDAIDECEINDRNPLLELLASRIYRLPKWTKFLITSRNITELKDLRKLKLEYLFASDKKNKEDIKTFIHDSFPLIPITRVSELIEKSEGSFVYVTLALEWMKDHNDSDIVPEFPYDLSDVYEINFNRQFKTLDRFTLPRAILEIMCSTLNPLSKEDIYAILKSDNSTMRKNELDDSFKALRFFLRIDKTVRLSHLTLYHWLVSDANQNFKISLQTGHMLISKYLFSVMGENSTNDIVGLAIHVANADDPSLENMFISSSVVRRTKLNNKALPHKLIWNTPCPKALELILHHFPDVNSLNEGNVTPAFVAAAKGHLSQMEILYKRGAHLSFHLERYFYISPYFIFQKIGMMKEQYYSGYNLLHIAAQHGHIEILVFILNINKTLLYEKNAMGLHVGHIACESGHINVVKKLNEMDANLFDERCMLYAAKENHIHILQWLTQNGVKIKCVSNTRSKLAREQVEIISTKNFEKNPRVLFPFDDDVSMLHVINPLDEWWYVLKIDPLLASIRYGSLDAARFLIEAYPQILECTDAFGYTAALSSVFYNRTELLPLLKRNLETDKCVKTPKHIDNMDTVKYIWEMGHKCPHGGSVAHVVALYNSDDEIILYCVKNGLDIAWNDPDAFGNYPIHYATSNNHISLLTVFISHNKLLGEKASSCKEMVTSNGSTVYHIAAISGQFVSMYILTNRFSEPIPDHRDSNNRSLLHYVGLTECQTRDNETELNFMRVIRYLVEVSNHNIRSRDEYGRNILHYGLKCLYNGVVNYLRHFHQIELALMFSEKDHSGSTPVNFTVTGRYQDDVMVIPSRCPFYDVFQVYCYSTADLPNLMAPWELQLVRLIQWFPSLKYYKFLEPHIKSIIENSPYLLTAMMVYLKDVDMHILRHGLILSSGRELMRFSLLAIARHMPNTYIVCGEDINDSPFHHTVLNLENRYTLFSFSHDIKNILRMVYGLNNKSKLSCSDKKGYNIFHYSLIGGNVQAARVLMWYGINMTNYKVTNVDIFHLALSSRKRENIKNFFHCSTKFSELNQISCTDIFLLEYFKRNVKHFTFKTFCDLESNELPLMHLLAANGMFKTLEAITEKFGQKSWMCTTKANFTPMYLAKLFSNKIDLPSYVTKTEVITPDVEAEEWFIWSLLYRSPSDTFEKYVTNLSFFGKSYLKRISEVELYFVLQKMASNTYLNTRQLTHDQIFLHKFLLQSMLFGISDKTYERELVHVLLDSTVIHKLISCQCYIESIYFVQGQLSFPCRQAISQLSECISFLQIHQEYLRLNSIKFRKAYEFQLRPVIQQLIVFNRSVTEICKEKLKSSTNHFKRVFFNSVIYMRKMISKLNKFIVNKSISIYIQLCKSQNIDVTGFSFLRSRMKALKFHSEKESLFRTEVLPLLAINNNCPIKFKYLSILKQTLAYKYLKTNLRVKNFNPDITIKKLDIAFKNISNPFRDLK